MNTTSRMEQVAQLGQSIWLDYIRRKFIADGSLRKLIDQGLRGVTSNPSIFEKAIGGSDDYADELNDPKNAQRPAGDVYEQLAIADIRAAADEFRRVYDSSNAKDGYVSLEVSPTLALNTQGTIDEAKRLWKTVDRPNVMIKVPGTSQGVPAIEELIASGININVTLLFSVDAYEASARAYIAGLKRYSQSHDDLSRIASVASFFVSRIDTMIDKLLEQKASSATGGDKDRLLALRGKIAIANAKIAYERFEAIFSGAEWEALAKKGAQKQRVLWASTGTKNPAYSDVLYLDSLIGPDTVNTVPPPTLDAFTDHGVVRNTVTEGLADAKKQMAELQAAGISMKDVTQRLLDDGVQQFSDAFDKLIAAVGEHKVQGVGR